MNKRDVAQLGSAPRLGRGGRTFKSCHPDHLFRYCIFIVSFCTFKIEEKNAEVTQLVESLPSKQVVASSSLVFRSILKKIWRHGQVVRQKPAKLLSPSSNLGVAFLKCWLFYGLCEWFYFVSSTSLNFFILTGCSAAW